MPRLTEEQIDELRRSNVFRPEVLATLAGALLTTKDVERVNFTNEEQELYNKVSGQEPDVYGAQRAVYVPKRDSESVKVYKPTSEGHNVQYDEAPYGNSVTDKQVGEKMGAGGALNRRTETAKRYEAAQKAQKAQQKGQKASYPNRVPTIR